MKQYLKCLQNAHCTQEGSANIPASSPNVSLHGKVQGGECRQFFITLESGNSLFL